jgi:hypothetical protein
MADSESTAPEVTELAEGLHRALSKLFSILRRGDPNTDTTGDLTLYPNCFRFCAAVTPTLTRLAT